MLVNAMICNNCKMEVKNPKAKFCPFCGKEIVQTNSLDNLHEKNIESNAFVIKKHLKIYQIINI